MTTTPRLHTHPRKELSQHFLKDKEVARQIVALLQKRSEVHEPVLEIGPGQGALTQWLVAAGLAPVLHLVEVDPALADRLRARFPALADRLICADFLRLRLAEDLLHTPATQPAASQISIIGNLPYHIGSQILWRVAEQRSYVPYMVCMLQKEVAKRLAAPPGSKVYGLLSVILQTFYQVAYELEVGPAAFHPAPAVDSAVITLTRYRTELPCPEDLFFSVIRHAFRHRRKKLRNNLLPVFPHAALLPEAVLSQRAEQLSAEDFVSLATQLAMAGCQPPTPHPAG